jgi:hypothetical protein
MIGQTGRQSLKGKLLAGDVRTPKAAGSSAVLFNEVSAEPAFGFAGRLRDAGRLGRSLKDRGY